MWAIGVCFHTMNVTGAGVKEIKSFLLGLCVFVYCNLFVVFKVEGKSNSLCLHLPHLLTLLPRDRLICISLSAVEVEIHQQENVTGNISTHLWRIKSCIAKSGFTVLFMWTSIWLDFYVNIGSQPGKCKRVSDLGLIID